jgi:hypothetical protein
VKGIQLAMVFINLKVNQIGETVIGFIPWALVDSQTHLL